MLGLQNEREWQVFCAKVLQQPMLAADERFNANAKRVARKNELLALITGVFSGLTIEQVIARLEDAQIANASVNAMSDVWAHPQLKARRRWVQVDTAAGPVPALLPPGLPASFRPRMEAVPALGQHSSDILRELGYSEAEVDRFRSEKAI